MYAIGIQNPTPLRTTFPAWNPAHSPFGPDEEKGAPMTNIEKLMAFEEGELDTDGVVELFQELVNTGMAWRLQGNYGRIAAMLVEQGVVKMPAEATTLSEREVG